jgi:hypothetical protein
MVDVAFSHRARGKSVEDWLCHETQRTAVDFVVLANMGFGLPNTPDSCAMKAAGQEKTEKSRTSGARQISSTPQ